MPPAPVWQPANRIKMRTSSKTPLFVAVAAAALIAGTVGVFVGNAINGPDAAPEAAKPAAGPRTLTIDNARIAAAGIQVFTPTAGALSTEVAAPGIVTSPPDAVAVLDARAAGSVSRITKRLGDPVRVGETLALIASRDASTMAADRATAAAKAQAARQAFAREQRLFDAKITARQDLEAAQAEVASAEAELRRASNAIAASHVSGDGRSIAVTSPISGRITAAPAVLGAYVEAGAELFRVADAIRIEVQAAIPPADAVRVSPGDRALVETGTGTINGIVRSVTPALDPETRAATAVLQLSGLVQPGQSVRVRIMTRAATGAGRFVVPSEAVQSVDGRDVVFVRTATGFVVRPVTVAARSDANAELAAGLKAGETLATKGAFLLKAELSKGEEEE